MSQRRVAVSPTPGSVGTRARADDRSQTDFAAIVMGASAGGITALRTILEGLPPDLPTPLLVVQHLGGDHASELADLLQRHSALAVRWARAGERFAPRTVYLAPPGHHLVASTHGCELSDAPPVQYSRPAVDVLFESAVRTWGSRTLGVVLTGAGTDGAKGARAIKRGLGVVIAQDEGTSDFFSMPSTTIRGGAADFVLPLRSIPPALVALTMVPGARSMFQTNERARTA